MLVLSRKRSQSLYIGDDIKITVVKIEGNQVRLGIEAPAGVSILREELLLDLDTASERHHEMAGAR
jgi:carbon storage regulator